MNTDDFEASVKAAIESHPRTLWRHFAEMDVYMSDENEEVFVEASFNSEGGTTLLHYPRQVALGALDALDGEGKACHVLVTTRDHVVRLTLDERFFELPEHELKRRIGQALRIT